MKNIISIKGFGIGVTFLLIISGIGSWWFQIPFWQALVIGFVCMVALGLVAAFENGDDSKDGSNDKN